MTHARTAVEVGSARRSGTGRRALAATAAIGLAALGLAAAASAAASATTPAAQDGRGAPLRYVVAGESGAKLRNIGDPKGIAVHEAAKDTPLAVHEERAGWLRVEVPGGYPAWIYGQYVAPAGAGDWYTVTGSTVQLRPLPESSNRSFPVDRVHAGDRVKLIERHDAQKPLGTDWVRVWSPPGTTGWVLAAETRRVPESSDARALWNAALASALESRAAAPAGGAAPRGASATPVDAASREQAGAALRAAEEALEALPETAELADVRKVRALYEQVLALSPDGPTEGLARNRLELVALREELARIRADLAEDRVRNEERRKKVEVEIADASRRKDPLWGRFVARGWLVREQGPDGKPAYVVRWAGDPTAVLVCTSGRYDLDRFVSYEIGIEGYRAPSAGGAAPERVDVRKLEVISGRPSLRR